mgnify:CR=1 FL=1
MIKIICGFLDPTKGQVKLNGTDIRNYNRKDYYKLFSAVFQDFSLLAGTIAENVAQTENFDLKQVKNCIKKAGLLPKIEALPDKYQTFLNREVYKNAIMLSGGETQRLMLARALYKDAPFIILDEPTAALDSIAEADIYQKYDEMTKGKSSVYISHRLASTRFCSRILMLEQGEIQEEGTHEELLRQSGNTLLSMRFKANITGKEMGKMKTNEKNISLKEALQINHRAYKIFTDIIQN